LKRRRFLRAEEVSHGMRIIILECGEQLLAPQPRDANRGTMIRGRSPSVRMRQTTMSRRLTEFDIVRSGTATDSPPSKGRNVTLLPRATSVTSYGATLDSRHCSTNARSSSRRNGPRANR
jgi:hypothetical protein